MIIIFDCGIYCKKMCRNNLVRNGKSKQLEVFDTGKPGLGVREKEEIEKGAFVVEYIGLRCTKDKHGNSEEGDDLSYTCRIDTHTVIDSKIYGNISHFVNHSCRPNCSLLPWTVDGRKRVILISNQRIQLDEEITISYGYFDGQFDDKKMGTKRQHRSKFECFCKAKKTKHFLYYK